MNINRHNYEESFLLYIDNELTVEQKKQVELFVKNNPDLEEEWIMLQQSKLVPDNTTVFREKELLMKGESNSFINLNNYEEWLVLYVDNELSPVEKKTVEKFAADHPQVQAELDLFQQTKLGTEKEFSFPNKELLYRHEERVKIISIRVWRVAAAAILIMGAGIAIYSIFNKNNNGGSAITKVEIVGTQKVQAPNPAKSAPANQQEPKLNTPSVEKEKGQVAVIYTPVNKPKQREKKKLSTDLSPLMAKTNTSQKRPVIVNEMNNKKVFESEMRNAVVTIDKKLPIEIINNPSVTNEPSKTPEPMYASNTENKRLRGFFRKATRLIERTSGINPANDDDRVLIGGMAINLK